MIIALKFAQIFCYFVWFELLIFTLENKVVFLDNSISAIEVIILDEFKLDDIGHMHTTLY